MNDAESVRWWRRVAPVGSPLWLPYLYAKRGLRRIRHPTRASTFRWYVVYRNILLPEQRAIYFYIPKVACSTLKKVFADLLHLPIPAGDLSEEVHLVDFPCANRYRLRECYADHFKFAFVRNPWSRLVSCYRDKLRYDKGHVYERYPNTFIAFLKRTGVYEPDMSFERFVDVVCAIPDALAEGHLLSQHVYLSDTSGRLLVDYVGRFESLDEDFRAVVARLGVALELPHLRATRHDGYREYYNAASEARVRARYARDIDMFEYQF